MPPSDPTDWLALHLVSFLNPTPFHRALERWPDPGFLARSASADDLVEAGLTPASASRLIAERSSLDRRVARELDEARRLGIELDTLVDPAFPETIAALNDAPFVLYRRGTLGEGIVRIAIVGSRRATAYGRRVATEFAHDFARRGVEVVSGGARGIDTCAHRGTLDGGGRTVAVIGSGLRDPYPPDNRELFERVAASGAVISEFPLEVGPRPENFPRRNRLIAALSVAVVVVEAAARSGSSITAGHALDYGRDVMAVPGPVSSPLSEGCHRLIQQGAKLVQNAGEVLEELSPLYRAALTPSSPAAKPPVLPSLTGDEAAVAGLLDDPEPCHIDVLAEKAPFGVGRLQAALFSLTLRGVVDALPGGYYLPRFPNPGRREDRP